MVGFLFGGNTGETPESLRRKRELIEELMVGQRTPQNWGEGWGAVMKGIATGIGRRRLDKAEAAGRQTATSTMDKIKGLITGTNPDIFGGSSAGNIPMSGGSSEISATTPGATPDMTGNDVYSGFMDTVKAGGVDNPYALAAIAATGNAESRFSPGNVNRTWSDPSESGQAGRAGGIMSWRGGRYDAMASTGDMSPAGQAKYFLNEDPQLIAKLNSAKSVEEAQSLMNNAWKFAGYNRPGGEAARRLQMAKSYLPSFQAGGETAALTAGDAIDAISPRRGNIPIGADPIMQQNMTQPSLSDEVAAYEQTPDYRAQFPGMAGQQQGQQGNQTLGADHAQLAGQQVNQMGGQPQQLAQAQQAGQQQAQGMSGPSLQQLYEAASNPWLSEQERGMVNMLLQQRMQEQDPMRQMELEKGRMELDALKNPKKKPLEINGRLVDPDSYEVLKDFSDGQDDQWGRMSDGRLFNKRSGEIKEAPKDEKAPLVDFGDISSVRKEVQNLPSYKNFAQALPIYRSMRETADRNSKASDLNLVYGLGKIMDPTSVVREGEMVMVQNTASLPDWLQGAIASLNGGAALTPDTRKAIMQEAFGRIKGYDDAFKLDSSMYRGIVDRNRINPSDVLPDFGTYEPWFGSNGGDPEIDELLQKYGGR